MRLGINNGFAMKRWPEPDQWSSLVADVLQLEEVQLSLDMVDLTLPWSSLQNQCRSIARSTGEHGLRIGSVFTGLGDYARNVLLDADPDLRHAGLQRYQRAVDVCALLQVPVFGGHMGAFSIAAYRSPRRAFLEEALFEHVAALALYAYQAGLKELLWEPMPVDREPPHTVALSRAYVERANQGSPIPIRLCLDVGHACAIGNVGRDADPYHWIRELAPLTAMVHVQQTDGLGDRHWPFTPETNARGIIEPGRVWAACTETDGSSVASLVIEVFPAFEADDDRVLHDMRATCSLWREHLASSSPQTGV